MKNRQPTTKGEGYVAIHIGSLDKGMRNSSDEQMIYRVIQSNEHSLGKYSTEDDGMRTAWNPKWK